MADTTFTEETKYCKVAIADSADNVYCGDKRRFVRLNVVGGAVITNRTEVNNASYGVLLSDYYIAVKNLSASRTITLPNTAEAGQTFIIKDVSGLCATYPFLQAKSLTKLTCTSVSNNNTRIQGEYDLILIAD